MGLTEFTSQMASRRFSVGKYQDSAFQVPSGLSSALCLHGGTVLGIVGRQPLSQVTASTSPNTDPRIYS